MAFAGIDDSIVCLYCETYQKIQPDYPVNQAEFEIESEVPRCQLHAQYQCSSCDGKIHFNGIAWCHSCELFTCIKCSEYQMKSDEFLVYDYYYQIRCSSCNLAHSTLDYAETTGNHPFQIGDLRPEGSLQVWLPLGNKVEYQPALKAWGNTRLRKMTIDVEFEPVDEIEGDSKQVWDTNAEIWMELTRSGDVNHREIIIPKMIEFMDPEQKVVMDAACGEGTFTRVISEAGYSVSGTDVSSLVDYAIELENDEGRGISYEKISIHQLKDHYRKNSFDQVTCNMAVMDIDNLDVILQNIRFILKPGGQFVFSITHPIFAWPVAKTIKLPRDSQHNEDKGWVVDCYLDEQPIKIHLPDMPSPMLYYPRMISTYVNSLLKHGFSITALAEPRPSDETIRKYPRDMYQDYDRNPIFMIFQTRLLDE